MRKLTAPVFYLLACLALCGCASGHNPKDPFESFNRTVYKFNDALDDAVIKPAAKGYNAVVPEPGKIMFSNFFSNLNDVIVTANDLLQFKLVQAASDTGRIAVNTTAGVYGLLDVASVVGLKKHNEDFGQTLGRWGIGSGPYLMLPLLGPSSVRDSIGEYVDGRTGVLKKIKYIDTRNEVYGASLLVRRAARLADENLLDEAAIDRYTFIRDAYLQRRQNHVYYGNPPREKFDDEEDDNKSEKSLPNDTKESALPTLIPVVAPVVIETSPITSRVTEPISIVSTTRETPAVLHVWVSQ